MGDNSVGERASIADRRASSGRKPRVTARNTISPAAPKIASRRNTERVKSSKASASRWRTRCHTVTRSHPSARALSAAGVPSAANWRSRTARTGSPE